MYPSSDSIPTFEEDVVEERRRLGWRPSQQSLAVDTGTALAMHLGSPRLVEDDSPKARTSKMTFRPMPQDIP